jgi:hypothetical protein
MKGSCDKLYFNSRCWITKQESAVRRQRNKPYGMKKRIRGLEQFPALAEDSRRSPVPSRAADCIRQRHIELSVPLNNG